MEDVYDYLVPKRESFEKVFPNSVNKVIIGSGDGSFEIGGDKCLPYFSSSIKSPRMALCVPESIKDFPEPMIKEFGVRVSDPFNWAMICIDHYKADSISLRFTVKGNSYGKWLDDAKKLIGQVSRSCDVPMILDVDGDPNLTAKSIDSLSMEMETRSILASASLNNDYKLLVKTAMKYNHILVSETDCDPTTQRTLNSKLIDEGLSREQLVMDPTTAALGLGIEYSISIIEQLKIEALKGDESIQFPIVATRAAPNSWRAREAWLEEPGLAPPSIRGPIWEAHTVLSLFLSGANLIAILHPKAAEMVKKIFVGE